ncbi:AbiH family protein [Acinetobacter terrestris]|uniref:AbiH family protein n=1 Tax=Acinetobacter terrestris TaxID=2529843 RepID=UPI00352699B7
MNILIVGNGFDLSHYLPTKYDHFMDVMSAIEDKNTGGKVPDLTIHTVQEWMDILDEMFLKNKNSNSFKFEMSFDELFSKIRDIKFIEKAKEYYFIDEINLSAKDVLKIQYKLELNCWYQYFKNHVKEVKTWIDFEQKIEEVLIVAARCIVDIENFHIIENLHQYFVKNKKDGLKIRNRDSKILNFFNVVKIEEYETLKPRSLLKDESGKETTVINERENINPKFCYGGKIINGFSPELFLDFLYEQLEEFIEIFNLYLELVVNKLLLNCEIEIKSPNWVCLDKIYSFNYTNTYQRLYDSVDVEYLHGSCGEHQNIVLGVSELHDESLNKLKAYGFTKYHQKLFKDTDYLFLDEFKKKIQQDQKQIEILGKKVNSALESTILQFYDKQLDGLEKNQNLNLNFYIWGHSLDYSDKNYITDLFSLNDDMDRNVRITIYYFDKNAKFTLLNNLLSILDKDKVEQWMKNKWLQFKPNPEIKFDEISSEKTA